MSASAPVVITLPGAPQGKGRPRFVRATGHAYTPKDTREYEAALKGAAKIEMLGRAVLAGPLKLKVIARFAIPESWSKKKQAMAPASLFPTVAPDVDNVIKCVGDALNKVVWLDDKQVVEASIRKIYSDRPSLWVEVVPLDEPAEETGAIVLPFKPATPCKEKESVA